MRTRTKLPRRSLGRRRLAVMAWLAVAAAALALTAPGAAASAATLRSPAVHSVATSLAGWYEVQNYYGLCLAMPYSSSPLGEQAELKPCNDGAQDDWYVDHNRGSEFLLYNSSSELCLSLPGTHPGMVSPVTQWHCNLSGTDQYEEWSWPYVVSAIRNDGSMSYMHPEGNKSYNGVKIWVNPRAVGRAYEWSFCLLGGGASDLRQSVT